MAEPIRVLLVDDDPFVRSGLRLLLSSSERFDVVGEASDGDEVVAAVGRCSPDVVLMDLRMARVDGVAATEAVQRLADPPYVVVLTTWDVDEAVTRSVAAGASGYILKSAGPDEIMRALAAVASGDGHLIDDPVIAARIAELECDLIALELTVLRVAANSHGGKPDPASSILKLRGSELQQDVLEFIADIAGPSSLSWDPDAESAISDWAHNATPVYLNFRKASIYGGSNEVQRQVISTGILGLKG